MSGFRIGCTAAARFTAGEISALDIPRPDEADVGEFGRDRGSE